MSTAARVVTAILLAFAAAVFAAPSAVAASPKLKLSVLSSRADMVSGGDALVAVDVPSKVKVSKVEIRRNGRDVTGAFAPSAANARRLVGLVDGLADGANRISALAKGATKAAELTLFNSAPSGPAVLGHRTRRRSSARTEAAGLGPATDADCSAPTQVEYRYRRPTATSSRSPTRPTRPADLAQTTTRDGQTVDYVVRVESGVINRSIYRWAILAPGGGRRRRAGTGASIYSFGGGCGAGYQQGSRAGSAPCSTTASSRGATRRISVEPHRPRHRLQRRALGRDRRRWSRST